MLPRYATDTKLEFLNCRADCRSVNTVENVCAGLIPD